MEVESCPKACYQLVSDGQCHKEDSIGGDGVGDEYRLGLNMRTITSPKIMSSRRNMHARRPVLR